MSHFQFIIIGGGQAGLSASYCLKKQNINHLILDRGQVGDTWKNHRWDSFCLVTPNWQCRLPGFPYDGKDPNGFMLKDEIVDYVKRYAASFDPPIQGDTEVYKVYKKDTETAVYYIETSKGSYTTNGVIIATGCYHIPYIPAVSKKLTNQVKQIHSADYKNPEQFSRGTILVVGSGQSGAQIAEDLHIAGKKVVLSVGDAPRVARNYRGKDVVEWLESMGYYNMPIANHPAGDNAKHKTNHYVTGRDGGRDIDLRQRAIEGMQLRGMLSSMEDRMIFFKPDLEKNLDNADATYNRIQKKIDDYITEKAIDAPFEQAYKAVWKPIEKGDQTIDTKKDNIEAIIWSTGFKVDFSWIDFPIYDEKGYPKYKRGVTSEAGLYFIGLPWLHTWGSGRFSHVADDAEYIAEHAAAFLATPII